MRADAPLSFKSWLTMARKVIGHHRLVQQVEAAGAGFAQPLGRGVAADEESRDGEPQRAAQALDDFEAGLAVAPGDSRR